jgi:hypothetical protein
MPVRNNRGGAIVEILFAGTLILLFISTIIQLAFLLSGKGAVETAAHFAARKFAITARKDVKKAKASALSEASTICRHRIGGNYTNLTMTTLDFFSADGSPANGIARSGESYQINLSHWVELVVPWANRILFTIVPVKKVRLGERFYFILNSSRMVTVE